MRCFHCELPAAVGGWRSSFLLGAERAFCCAGCEASRNFPGEGIEGTIEGRRLRVGSRSFCEAIASSPCAWRAKLYLAGEGEWLAAFELDDPVRPDATELVQALRRRGVRITLASGDDPAVVERLALGLGIERWRGAMTPQGKHDLVAGRCGSCAAASPGRLPTTPRSCRSPPSA